MVSNVTLRSLLLDEVTLAYILYVNIWEALLAFDLCKHVAYTRPLLMPVMWYSHIFTQYFVFDDW